MSVKFAQTKDKTWEQEDFDHDFFLKTTEVNEVPDNPFFVVIDSRAGESLVE